MEVCKEGELGIPESARHLRGNSRRLPRSHLERWTDRILRQARQHAAAGERLVRGYKQLLVSEGLLLASTAGRWTGADSRGRGMRLDLARPGRLQHGQGSRLEAPAGPGIQQDRPLEDHRVVQASLRRPCGDLFKAFISSNHRPFI